MEVLSLISQTILIIIFAPLVSGIITKIKNNLRFRRGPSIFQPYYNLAKYFSKEAIISDSASWIFKATPYIVFASTVTAVMIIPVFIGGGITQYIGDFIAVIFLLALGRFFLALAGLDPATTFGGMGSSREMFISSFVEPVAIMAIFAAALTVGTTNLTALYGIGTMTTSLILAAASIFLITLAETARIPIDNQETHLELTMVHEAMVLEYGGRSLALLELAAYVKQLLFFIMISLFILPGFGGLLFLIAKILVLAIVVAFTEVSIAKMRLFRVVDFMFFAGILAILALIAIVLGV
ncbi:MAG: NADH-quinone oxidoreductase subunit H [Candidatus Saganbacteria bacterium]|nr:NADH-quinone oxidoreductase subunit H [Candidatus Saganbacteria bacterium]